MPFVQSPYDDDLMVSFLMEGLAALIPSRPEIGLAEISNVQITRAVELLGQSDLLAEEVAATLGISRRTLLRRIREEFGMSVPQLRTRLRMERAAQLLLAGNLVQDVSAAIGMHDPSQFSRMFRAAFGTSPKQFQATYRPGRLLHGREIEREFQKRD